MGAFLAAEAGLLTGQTVTTHWRRVEELQDRYPDIRVQSDPLFTRNGKMWSSAGVTAGIDLALAMVEEDHGHHVAMQVAQSLVVFLKRPGGQSQFSNVLAAQKDDSGGTFSDLHAWIAGNLQADLVVEKLAQHAGMSPRTFARLYKERTGITPAKSVEMMRVDAAKHLLEQTATALAKIATRTGLVDEQRMRRAFLRHVGVSPHEYRRTFGTQSG
jgi:transcriptional regulator GlxA family with amidase domain